MVAQRGTFRGRMANAKDLMKKSYLALLALLAFGFILVQCNDPEKSESVDALSEELAWRNHHDTVSYVGMQMCMSCHGEIHHTFQHTGMGMSFGKATLEKAHYDWNGSEVIYDEALDLHYQPFFRDSLLFVREFRIYKGDTVHNRVQQIQYIIGSGQHTNSHIYNVNGYLYQAPFTYYTQKERADLPPGYEDGANSRFSRIIGLECMSCHNAMPTGFQIGSENRFSEVPLGIDCERCHGPGELHVSEKLKGIIVDTAVQADNSIVNPRRLSAELQMELCQRCHLQGNAVLKSGKSFFDFKPGMYLSEVMDVYLPRYDDSEHSFIMASHADRLKLSECFKAGEGDFNCISCHNPHVSVRETNLLRFNQTCTGCHGGDHQTFCLEEEQTRQAMDDNCVACHMPSSSSNDIPHVSVHDHWIRVPEERSPSLEGNRTLLALVAINNDQPSHRSKARAFLQQVEQFEGGEELLDSAWKYIQKLPREESFTERVHLFHLKGTPGLLRNYINQLGTGTAVEQLTERSFDNRHAWTAYRIGEAYNSFQEYQTARAFYQKAVQLAPQVLDFRNKLGAACLKLGDIESARSEYAFMYESNPYLSEAHNNLGYVELFYGDTLAAVRYFEDALKLDPDYHTARLNLVSTYIAQEDIEKAKTLFKPLLERFPEQKEYLVIWEELERLD